MVDPDNRDIHVLKYFSSFVSVLDGKVIHITDPTMSYCPLASHLYEGFKAVDRTNKEAIKQEIRKAIESKIKEYGLFTPHRKLLGGDVAITYGASEMLMFALRKKAIEAAVVVCDGAGTVITDNAEVVQGVGARMNSLVLTSPIRGIRDQLQELGCHVVSDNALILQEKGVEKAIKLGYRKIAVTVSGHDADKLERIRALEDQGEITLTILLVCTTGVSEAMVEQIQRYADVVWSCASGDVRRKIGACALLQISKQIPVFVLTRKGIDLVASCSDDQAVFSNMDERKQYLISDESGGKKVKLGVRNSFLREEALPVLSGKSFAVENA